MSCNCNCALVMLELERRLKLEDVNIKIPGFQHVMDQENIYFYCSSLLI